MYNMYMYRGKIDLLCAKPIFVAIFVKIDSDSFCHRALCATHALLKTYFNYYMYVHTHTSQTQFP